MLEEIKNIMNNSIENANKKIVKHGDSIDSYFQKHNTSSDIKNENRNNNIEKCEFEYTVKMKNGMHARPAGKIVSIAKSTNAKVTISANGKSANGNSITNIMALGIVDGANIKVSIEGYDVNKIRKEIEKILKED